jgi:hypothetical protein
MHRVCRDPLLPVQARLWPPDVLFWEFFFPQKFPKKIGNHANTNIKMVWPKPQQYPLEENLVLRSAIKKCAIICNVLFRILPNVGWNNCPCCRWACGAVEAMQQAVWRALVLDVSADCCSGVSVLFPHAPYPRVVSKSESKNVSLGLIACHASTDQSL